MMNLFMSISDIREGKAGEVPKHLKDTHYSGADSLGRGQGYKYPHNYDNAWVKQDYLPDRLAKAQYYLPKINSKFETALSRQFEKFNTDQ